MTITVVLSLKPTLPTTQLKNIQLLMKYLKDASSFLQQVLVDQTKDKTQAKLGPIGLLELDQVDLQFLPSGVKRPLPGQTEPPALLLYTPSALFTTLPSNY